MAERLSKIPETGRSLEQVLQFHPFGLEAFAGKSVLDIGCGRSNLQEDLALIGVNAFVVGLDTSRSALMAGRTSTGEDSQVEASAVRLPFKSDSFDLVLAIYSLPRHSSSILDIESFFSEAKRVTKTEGLLSIYPFCAGTSIIDLEGVTSYVALSRAIRNLVGDSVGADSSWYEISSLTHGYTALRVT